MALSIGVIGATGMAGSAITKEALKQGLNVKAFVRNESKARDMFGDQATIVSLMYLLFKSLISLTWMWLLMPFHLVMIPARLNNTLN